MNNKLDVQITNKFKKQYAKIRKQSNFKKSEFEKVINMLSNNEILPTKYNNHLLNPKINRNLGVSHSARYTIRI